MSWNNRFQQQKSSDSQPSESPIVPRPARGTPTTSGLSDIPNTRHTTNAPYFLPTTLGEAKRLEFQHYMLRSALSGNYAAPIEDPRQILDVGSGTGRWAMDLAKQFPRSVVVGLDIRQPYLDPRATPPPAAPNYTFIQGNVLERLPFADNTFDYVHQRYLSAAIPAGQWPGVVRELLRVTRPGGWIELLETSAIIGAPALNQLARWEYTLGAKRGINLRLSAVIGDFLRDTGVTNITAQVIELPVGKLAGRIGAMVAADYLAMLATLSSAVVHAEIVDETTYETTLDQARFECEIGSYIQPVYLAYGQK